MAENNENIDDIFDAWEEAILTYDRTTRPILRRLRSVLATASNEQLEDIMDSCG